MNGYIWRVSAATMLMAAAKDNGSEELPADKIKREAAEKAAADKAAAEEAALKGPADDEGDGADEEGEEESVFQAAAPKNDPEEAEAAAKKLRLIATAYPDTTPHEHTVFGFGGHRFTLGELRALFGLKR